MTVSRSVRAVALLTVILFCGLGGFLYWLLGDLPSAPQISQRAATPSTQLLDRHGRVLYQLIDPGGGKHIPIAHEQVPTACIAATLATEDAGFYQHPGVDARAIIRALWVNLRSAATISGGSTITQQAARNLLLDAGERQERTLRRKLREAWLAWRLERSLSKDEILTLYLNQTYYGNFAIGLEAAAQAYFAKSANELSVAECALLAGLPQAPGIYNPLHNPEAAQSRQRVVLDRMVAEGMLSATDAQAAASERLHYAATPFSIVAPHFVMYVRSLLERWLDAETLRTGGLRVYTTLDLDQQREAERIVRRHLQQLRNDPDAPRSRRIDNAALVALDPANGEIWAMVGSPDYFDARIQGNLNAALTLRQPGSALKPFTYALAVDPELAARYGFEPMTAATVLADVPTSFPTREGAPYVPLNYDRQFKGPMRVREALAQSQNVPAVKVLQHVGVNALVDLARAVGITSLRDRERYGLALTLGGGEVSLLELTSAYAVVAQGGVFVAPRAVLRIEDAEGALLWEAANPTERQQVISPQAAYLVTHILSDADARMPAFGRGRPLNIGRPAAVKTGTTTDWRDNWTVGYTPQLVTGVWVGNADNGPMLGVSGVTGAAPIWHDFMTAFHRNLPVREFARPGGLAEREICAVSGMLPAPLCPHRVRELFIAGTEPAEHDTFHQEVALDQRTGLRASDETPADRIVRTRLLVLPPEYQAWAREQGLPQPPPLLPPTVDRMHSGRQAAVSEKPIAVIAPNNGATYRIVANIPVGRQRLELQAQVSPHAGIGEITFQVNGEPVERVGYPYRSWWTLQPGVHTVAAVAGEHRSVPVIIYVEEGP